MPLQKMRSLWSELVGSRAFWVSYLSAGVSFSPCKSLCLDQQALWGEPYCAARLSFRFQDSHRLEFSVSAGEHSLTHFHPEYNDSLLVGTMDSHQMSDLFRWDEYQAVIGHLAEGAGPFWAYELLFSFYVAVTQDCADLQAGLLRRCLIASEVFAANEIDHILAYSRRTAVRRDFRWIHVPELGWTAEGRNAYSMRHRSGGFDFARFGRFLRAVSGSG
jgi:hypothetical protein